MHPILLEIAGFPIHTYGVLVATGFFTGTLLIRQLAKMQGLDSEKAVDFCFQALMVGFIGARFVFILTQWRYFLERPIEVFYFWEGGLVFYGGPLFAVPYSFYFAKKNKISLPALGDVAVPGLTLGHAIGRLGCVAAGCCFGKPCAYPWGMRLHSELVDVHLRGIPLHPTPIYESISLFLLVCLLVWRLKNRKFTGEITLLYFIAYALIRFIIEFFRGDEVRGFVFGSISTSQFISVFFFVIALIIYVKKRTTMSKT